MSLEYQHNSSVTDAAQLQATMAAVEQACLSIQMSANPAVAEATLLSLSRSTRPYKACQFILENSLLANARFQAAGAIRNAALREWEILDAEERKRLISFCLCFIMQHANLPEGYVLVKVGAVAAQLLKRGWLDFRAVEKGAFFLQVENAIRGSHGLGGQFAAIKFLESLVSEFSPLSSTAMGLPREFHQRCRLSLEQEYIKAFYSWAQFAAFNVSNAIIESNSEIPEIKVCSAALSLMFQILNWDFQGSKATQNSKKGIDLFYDVKKPESSSLRPECILVMPGPAWYDVLISGGHVGWLLNFYTTLRQKFCCQGYWPDCPLAVSARKLIVQLCSVNGSIFPDSGHIQRQHLLQLLSGITQWMEPPEAVSSAINCGKSESELLDGCRALMSMANVTTPTLFDELLKSLRPYGTMTLLSAVMHETIKDLMENGAEEERWSWIARDILLDTWTALLSLDGTGLDHSLQAEGINAAANLFALIVESELKAAAASAFSDQDEYHCHMASVAVMDERLSCYALIARAAIGATIPLLTKLFSDSVMQLHQIKGIKDPTETLEQIYSLLLIIGHVLADEGLGETPLVPKEIECHYSNISQMDEHPVILLSSAIITFAGESLDSEVRSSLFSPRLMEAVVWFLARWSLTYLMPTDKCGGNDGDHQRGSTQLVSKCSKLPLLNFFGESSQGTAVLDLFIRISFNTLVSYPGEKRLEALICNHLLHGLVKRKNIVSHLVNLDSWRGFANSFANERVLCSLNAAHQRSLAQSFTLSACGIKNSETSYKYIENLTSNITNSLVELSRRNDLKAIVQQPDVILLVSCSLERLRGVARASEPCIQKAIYQIGSSLMQPIIIFLEEYKDEYTVVYLLLKFVAEWVAGQLIYLEAQESSVVIDFCMRLLQLYSSHNVGKISLSLSNRLQTELDVEKYKDLRALLQLLSNLCSKDLVDFAAEPIEAYGATISQVLYAGLHCIAPLITPDMLKYPKLCHSYFSLLSHMVEVYPDILAQLTIESSSHISGSLEFGLHHQDVDVVDLCLQALRGLASHHYKEICAGRVGLGMHVSSYRDSAGNFHEGILSKSLRLIFQLLLFEDYSIDLVSSAADALLPLLLCESSVYQNLVNELTERQLNPTFRSRLINAFLSLTTSNGLSSTLNRPNHQIFRKNLHSFLIEVRGFLRTV